MSRHLLTFKPNKKILCCYTSTQNVTLIFSAVRSILLRCKSGTISDTDYFCLSWYCRAHVWMLCACIPAWMQHIVEAQHQRRLMSSWIPLGGTMWIISCTHWPECFPGSSPAAPPAAGCWTLRWCPTGPAGWPHLAPSWEPWAQRPQSGV